MEYKNDGTTNVLWTDSVGGVSSALSVASDLRDGLWHSMQISAAQSGADIAVVLYKDGLSIGSGTVVGKTLTLPSVISVGDSAVGVGMRTAGLVGIYKSNAAPSAAAASGTTGYVGETTLARFGRLCAAQSVPFETAGTTTIVMGAQSSADFLGQLREVEATECGTLVETLGGRVRLDAHSVRENAPAVLVLDLLTATVDLRPTTDDRLTANDWTVSRIGGGSGHFADSAHVAKYGLYDRAASVNVQADAMLVDQAAIRVSLGTVPGLRHPYIAISLRARPDLVPAVLACDISTRIVSTNQPTGMRPVDVITEGYTEVLDSVSWDVVFQTSPFQPYNTAVSAADVGDNTEHLGHADWDSCVLAAGIDATQTSVTITTTPLMTTDPDDFWPPWKIIVDGEHMRVRRCDGASNPQTLTVDRSINGIVKTHAIGATVELHPESACYAGLSGGRRAIRGRPEDPRLGAQPHPTCAVPGSGDRDP